MDHKQLYKTLKSKYDKCRLELEQLIKLLHRANYVKCTLCESWGILYLGSVCYRCGDYYCQISCQFTKCTLCKQRFCHKCSVYPCETPYICSSCPIENREINSWIPDNYAKLPIYYKNEIFWSLLVMKRICNPPKYIRFFILNLVFGTQTYYSELRFGWCDFYFGGSEKRCGYPIFDPTNKYCASCLQRSEVKKILHQQHIMKFTRDVYKNTILGKYPSDKYFEDQCLNYESIDHACFWH